MKTKGIYQCYIFRETGTDFYKIGICTGTASERLQGVRNGNPRGVDFVRSFAFEQRDKAIEVEQKSLKWLAGSRVNGEWVKAKHEKDLIAAVRNIAVKAGGYLAEVFDKDFPSMEFAAVRTFAAPTKKEPEYYYDIPDDLREEYDAKLNQATALIDKAEACDDEQESHAILDEARKRLDGIQAQYSQYRKPKGAKS